MTTYRPEGLLIDTPENCAYLKSISALEEAMREGRCLEGRAVVCDSAHNLYVDLGCTRGIIPREEGALGIEDGSTRDIAIISRVNKPVAFQVIAIDRQGDGAPRPILSRRLVQKACMEEYLTQLRPGDIIDARVTHLEPFGCFVDVGCGISSLIPIDAISVSRISHPRDRFHVGQDIQAVVRQMEPGGRISLSHKELLGTWLENAAAFAAGETVVGLVRSVEPYGVFVELAPNLAGLAEAAPGLDCGQLVSVYIKSIIPEKMKIKLVVLHAMRDETFAFPLEYRLHAGHIRRWIYSVPGAARVIETIFDG